MIYPILYVLLALDDAAVFDRVYGFKPGAIIALVLAIIAVVVLLLPLRSQPTQ